MPGSGPCPPHVQADSQPLDHQGSPVAKFFPRNLFSFNLRKTAILLVSAIHQHGSAIAIVTSPPLWQTFNLGILCYWSCPCRSGHTPPLSPWQDDRLCLFCPFFISLWKGKCNTFQVQRLENSFSPSVMSDSLWSHRLQPPPPPASSVHGDSPGKNTGVGCHFLVQGIFPTEGSSSGLPHCRRILYHLIHQGSPAVDNVIQYSPPHTIYIAIVFHLLLTWAWWDVGIVLSLPG